MLCQSCRNAEVSEDETICPNCEKDPRGPVKAKITADHVRCLNELDEAGDIAGLRDFAFEHANNPIVSKEANRRADALYEKQNPFTYPCPACDHSTRERRAFIRHLTDQHAFLPARAEDEAATVKQGSVSIGDA